MHLNEAFRALNALNEDTFSFSDDGIEKLSAFRDSDEEDDTISVIDPKAETAEDTADSYVGKVIIDCSVCHSKIYKDKEEVKVDGEMANTDEECPYCYSTEGFKVIGEIQPFGGASADDEEDESDDASEVDTDGEDNADEDDNVVEEAFLGIKSKKEKEAERKRQAERDAEKKAEAEEARKAQEWKDYCERSYANGQKNRKPQRTYSSSTRNPDDDYVYVQGNGTGTYRYREDLEKDDNVVEEGIFGRKKKSQQKSTQGASSVKPQEWELFDIIRDMSTGQRFPSKYEAEKEAAAREKATGHVYKVQLVESSNKVNESSDDDYVYIQGAGYGTYRPRTREDLENQMQNESISSLKSKSVNEDINNLSLDTDDTHLELTADENGKVTVSTEPVQAAEVGDEVIAPVTDETQAEIEMNGEEIPAEEGAMDDVEIDDFDEESFDGMEESYLRESYDNVKSYKTTSVEQRGQKLFIEGVITFDNGKQKKTNIVLEATTCTKSGKYNFILESKAHRPSHKNFNITGRLDNGKFITESASIKRNTRR